MTNHEIDNSLKNLGKTVLWQYDKATRLLAIMKHMQVLYHCAVEQFWDFWNRKILSIDSCGEFGATIWGIFLGIRRPIVVSEDGDEHTVAVSVYRKILKGAFFLMKSGCDFSSICKYVEYVYGIDGKDNISKWSAHVSEYGWTTNVDELNGEYETGKSYRAGDIFYHNGRNWLCTQDIHSTENTSFEVIKDNGWIELTDRRVNVTENSDTVLLKLIDPNGIVRKISGAPIDSMSITVRYQLGDTVIEASAARSIKCGVELIDNGDLTITYQKSPYFSEMHRDQQAVFEQHKDEFLPYPLGIKTNEPTEVWMFGLAGSENEQYESKKSYSKGDIFGYVDNEGHAFNWECLKDISSTENGSFDEIKDNLRKTMAGDRFVATFSDDDPPYRDYRT